MSMSIEFGGGDYFALRFPYHRHFVRCIRSLNNRRWDADGKCWYVHLSHLPEVMELFQFKKEELPPKLWRAYQIYRIKTSRLKIVVGATMAHFEGDRFPLDQVSEATSFHVPGYQYTPSYMEHRWDGKRHLFDRRKLCFPAGLLQRVAQVLEKEKLHFEIVAPQPPSAVQGTKYMLPEFELRDYQRECVKAALAARRGVLEMATGAGKTVVAAQIIYELGLPALFFVHTRDLLHQTHDFFREHLCRKVGIVGDGQIHLAPLTVATLQTVARAMDIPVPPSADEEAQLEEDATDISHARGRLSRFVEECPVVFFDECHHLPAETFYSLAMRTTGAWYRYGLSATPYRSDRMDLLLEAAVGPKMFRANASVLIEKGYLVPPEITFLAPPAYHGAPSRSLDYATMFHDYVVANPARNDMVATEARRLAADNKSVLILVSQVAHGQRLAMLLPEAVFVQGNDSAVKRQRVFKKLEAKEQLIVIATTLADEGLDVPTLDAVILASGGKSETRTLQRIGRALRPAPGKTKATVIDFFDNAPFLKEHSLRRYEIYSTEPQFRVLTSGFDA
jgi:superfamily II DNA or RNA helicase